MNPALTRSLTELSSMVCPASKLERPPVPTVPFGVPSLDDLTGGLPRGGLTEIFGPTSSGRTAMMMSVLAQATARGEVCALVDASDCFDPLSAEHAGVALKRVLWVRCRGTSLADGRLSFAEGHEPRAKSTNQTAGSRKSRGNPDFFRLEQALKTTDLLLQGGGFGLIVLDLASLPAAVVRRVPLTSWFRFRRAVENTPTVFLVLEPEPFAKTCASLVIGMSAVGQRVSAVCPIEGAPSHTKIFEGIDVRAELARGERKGVRKEAVSYQLSAVG